MKRDSSDKMGATLFHLKKNYVSRLGLDIDLYLVSRVLT